ncbi:DUF4238 domain-containing protein [Pararhodobacter zhoushanensis]|uniref:DUF4238 domain-containing protein n=1 Tax=Pararhodobacter zhoushanensis TaxID=2479545 RepID=UPI0013DF0DF1|nr:DUF4238 domain-containing protein [Pararhodobacter zhoushanensis]
MSGEKRSRLHHYVPKALQRQFCSDGEKIWYSSRLTANAFGAPECRNINSTFRVRDLYTVLDDSILSDRVERDFYGALDDYFGKLLPEVNQCFEKGGIPIFQDTQLRKLRSAVFEMLKRTPEGKFNFGEDEALGREAVKECLARAEKIDDLNNSSRYRAILQDDKKLKAWGRDIRVRGTITKMDRVLEKLEEYSVRWIEIDGKCSFVLPGSIVLRVGNGGPNGLINPKMEMWMPIGPKRCMVLLRDVDSRIPLIVFETAKRVRNFNEFAVRQSQSVASHSEKLLKSVTNFCKP